MRIIKWIIIYILAFILAFIIGLVISVILSPDDPMKVEWNDSVGQVYSDFEYGEGEANKFDLYVPADNSKESYGLVVYLHAGGFYSGDKSDDASILQYFASKGYVAAGINYTLRTEDNEDASVYKMSNEIKGSMPYVIEEAKSSAIM